MLHLVVLAMQSLFALSSVILEQSCIFMESDFIPLSAFMASSAKAGAAHNMARVNATVILNIGAAVAKG